MRPTGLPSRRDFLATSGRAASAAWLGRLAPAVLAALHACAIESRRSGAPFTTFTEREGADFAAFAARILPSDGTPGATEAGCVYFADQALEGVLADLLPPIRGLLADLNGRAAAVGSASFANLDVAEQDAIVGAVEQGDPGAFFFARSLVALGFVTSPEHGGNRDGVGWETIGFEDTFAYQPPFGFYDRDEHRRSGSPGA